MIDSPLPVTRSASASLVAAVMTRKLAGLTFLIPYQSVSVSLFGSLRALCISACIICPAWGRDVLLAVLLHELYFLTSFRKYSAFHVHCCDDQGCGEDSHHHLLLKDSCYFSYNPGPRGKHAVG